MTPDLKQWKVETCLLKTPGGPNEIHVERDELSLGILIIGKVFRANLDFFTFPEHFPR
jgi:hypothetical protein